MTILRWGVCSPPLPPKALKVPRTLPPHYGGEFSDFEIWEKSPPAPPQTPKFGRKVPPIVGGSTFGPAASGGRKFPFSLWKLPKIVQKTRFFAPPAQKCSPPLWGGLSQIPILALPPTPLKVPPPPPKTPKVPPTMGGGLLGGSAPPQPISDGGWVPPIFGCSPPLWGGCNIPTLKSSSKLKYWEGECLIELPLRDLGGNRFICPDVVPDWYQDASTQMSPRMNPSVIWVLNGVFFWTQW